MPPLQWWLTEWTLQVHFVNWQDTCFEFVAPAVHSLPVQLCQTKSLVAVVVISKNTIRFKKKKSMIFIVVAPCLCRTQRGFSGASNTVVEPFSEQAWAKPSRVTPSSSPALGALLRAARWRSCEWGAWLAVHRTRHGELAWGLGLQEHCAGDIGERGGRRLRVQKGNCQAFPSRVPWEFV